MIPNYCGQTYKAYTIVPNLRLYSRKYKQFISKYESRVVIWGIF